MENNELQPFADDFNGIFLPRLLLCAASADGEASFSQDTVPQVHLITHIEKRVLQQQTGSNNHKHAQTIWFNPLKYIFGKT